MNGLAEHLALSLRLHFRNKMALLYGYLFPLIFLVAFWVLYRHENVPLLRHMGELLTVSVLGGACFGLPTTMVGERERGVWRRYRLTPIPTWALVTSTVVARYVIVLTAGLLQLAVALAVGMTLPAHPLELAVAFAFVSLAFIGLGLVIAMMADTVPAVQALGQCIFLPMLIIGGVAVKLSALPPWAQHVSAFFPGRYAVEALQACVDGPGLAEARFSLLALALIGAAGCVAGAKLFRWDAQESFSARAGKAWLAPVLGAWLAVGLLAEWRGRIAIPADAALPVAAGAAPATVSTPAHPEPLPPVAPVKVETPVTVAPPVAPPPAPPPSPAAAPAEPIAPAPPAPAVPVVRAAPTDWTHITDADIASLDYRVPSDGGVVSPFAPAEEQPPDYDAEQLETVRQRLPDWPPANIRDDVQRVRNVLYVAGIPDAVQLPIESYVPWVALEYLMDRYPREQLVQILAWIVMHPEDGTVIDEIADLGLEGAVGDPYLVRERAYLYALKFILRLTGRSGR